MFFFFNDTATTEIYTLSLHDALPISPRYITGELCFRGSPYGGEGPQHATGSMKDSEMADLTSIHGFRIAPLVKIVHFPENLRSEEHTSELQSQSNIVCRLLLAKKKTT